MGVGLLIVQNVIRGATAGVAIIAHVFAISAGRRSRRLEKLLREENVKITEIWTNGSPKELRVEIVNKGHCAVFVRCVKIVSRAARPSLRFDTITLEPEVPGISSKALDPGEPRIYRTRWMALNGFIGEIADVIAFSTTGHRLDSWAVAVDEDDVRLVDEN